MSDLTTWLLLPALGALAGLSSGMAGLGGAVLVPLLALWYEARGFPAAVALPTAFGTGLSVLTSTALTAGMVHVRRSRPPRRQLVLMAASGMIGAPIGAYLSTQVLAPVVLRLALAAALLVCGALLLATPDPSRPGGPDVPERPVPLPLLFGVGLLVSLVSATVGLGGTVFLLPVLTLLLRQPIRLSVALSIAVSLPTGAIGSLSYAVYGLARPGRPDTAVGYVDLPVAAGLALAMVPTAYFAAKLVGRVSPRRVRQVAGLVLLAISARTLLAGLATTLRF